MRRADPRRWTRCSSAAGRPRCSAVTGWPAVLDAVRDAFVLADGAEVTTEANPESTSPEFFARSRTAGYTRVSLGMQSVAPHVLAVLDRVHSPGRALDAAREAPRRRLRPRQPRPHLRHAGGVRRRPAPLGGRRDRRRRRPRVRPTRWWSRTARRWRAGCVAARSRLPTTTCSRSATSCSTRGCRRQASTGTRSPTGAGPAASAGTTSATGTVASGGAPDRERTATSARLVGGTSSTPTLMRSRWPTG